MNCQLIVLVTFQAKILNICLFQLLKCEDVLLLFVIYENKWRAFGFRGVVWVEEAIWTHHLVFFEIVTSVFHNI